MQNIALLKIDKKYRLEGAREKRSLFILFFILFSTYPYVFYRIIPLPPVAVLQVFTLFYYLKTTHTNNYVIQHKFRLLLIAQAVVTFLCLIINLDLGYYKQILYLFWVYLFLILINDFGVKKFLYYYNRIITIVAILGAISAVLAFIFGVHPLLEYTNMDGRPGWLVYFTFTNVQTLGIIRYSGIFDEAGAFAGWAMFSLLTNKLYIKDDKIEIPLIVATLFTFSFGFIAQLLLYILFFYVLKGKSSVKFATIIIVAISTIVFLHYVPEDSPAYQLTVGRLGLDQAENFFENNNRTEMIQVARKIFQQNPIWGVGTTRFYSGEYAGDNPYETLAKDGIVGTLFLYLPLLWLAVKSKFKLELLFTITILVAGYSQRPFHTNLQHYIMLYLLCFCGYMYYLETKKIVKT